MKISKFEGTITKRSQTQSFEYPYFRHTLKTAETILKQYWGFPSFRPLQKAIIDRVLAGEDVLALLPTGGGKSLCYQVPAMVKEGLTIVVSPLIALMKDQVARLKAIGISADAIYSGMDASEIDRLLDNARFGHTRLLYLSPERLNNPMFQERVTSMPVSLLAIDEAHCISQWGHDFRPSYLEVGALRELFPSVPLLALTASATKEVTAEILALLKIKDSAVVRDSFGRENLNYHVIRRADQLQYVERLLRKSKGSTIIYARHRRKCVELADWLMAKGIHAAAYHGGMAMMDRDRIQEAWVRGEKQVMVATNAFGMGVDKSDVRLVIHYDLPAGIEEYYQEAGRAGRDGKPAYCLIVINDAAQDTLIKKTEQSYPEIELIKQIYASLHIYLDTAVGSGLDETFDFDLESFAARFNYRVIEAYTALKELARDGWIAIDETVLKGSRVQIITDTETLQTGLETDPTMDQLMKALLRGYEGLWSSMVRIREDKIAKHLHWDAREVKRLLTRLKALELIDYRESTERSQVTLLRERVPLINFTIDEINYKFRKERAFARMKSMIDYLADEVECREVFIRQYFNESDALPCGHCDRCLNDQTGNDLALNSVYKALADKNGITIKDFLAEYQTEQQPFVKKELRQLSDERKIKIVEDKIYRNS